MKAPFFILMSDDLNRRITRSAAHNNLYAQGFVQNKGLRHFDEDLRKLDKETIDTTSSSKSEEIRNIYPDLNKLLKTTTPLELQAPLKTKIIESNLPTNTIKMGKSEETKSGNSVSGHVVSLKDALGVVPKFDGNPNKWVQFAEGCKEALGIIPEHVEENLTKLLRAKLEGEARASMIGLSHNTVEEFLTHLADIFGPAQTLNQSLGELGNECQHAGESVLTFANRLRLINSKILEAKKREKNMEALTQGEKQAFEENLFTTFKKRLRDEIRLSLPADTTSLTILKNAIKIEKDNAIISSLRQKVEQKVSSNFLMEKSCNSCHLCNESGHVATECNILNVKKEEIRTFCNGNNHNVEKCFAKLRLDSERCQLCNKQGHVARDCRPRLKCQICNRQNHEAKDCRSRQVNNIPQVTCQLCNMPGHSAIECNSNKQNNSNNIMNQPSPRTTDQSQTTCYYCKQPGHILINCKRRRMNNERYNNQGNGQGSPAPVARQGAQSNHLITNQQQEMNLQLFPN